jgi:predicted RNA methylase
MFSVKGDQVLDPFIGTGTTTAAAIAAGRSSMGYDMDTRLIPAVQRAVRGVMVLAGQVTARRLARHQHFVEQRTAAGKSLKHMNDPYGFPVITPPGKVLAAFCACRPDSNG